MKINKNGVLFLGTLLLLGMTVAGCSGLVKNPVAVGNEGQENQSGDSGPTLIQSSGGVNVNVSTTSALAGICDWRTPEDSQTKFPKLRLFRVFVPNVLSVDDYLVTKVGNACRSVWDAGMIPVVSFKLEPADVVAGKWDTKLTNLGKWLSQKPETWIIPWHEPENDLTPSQFVGMFNHVYSKIKSVNAAAKIGYVSMAYAWRESDGRTANPTAWKPAKSDFFACDVYSGNSFPLTKILPEHTGFSRWRENIVGSGTYLIAERGFFASTTSQKAERVKQIKREADWLVSTELGKKCQAYMYWNT
ncbi:MAG: hypothetical protein JNM63_12105, partial [Spirochaetia bacterium]|nr:hypothetical protein [Spirochaetia bacterium]